MSEGPPTQPPHDAAAAQPAPPVVDLVQQHGTYELFTSNPRDMVGHVAYAMYKRDKLAFCHKTKTDAGRDPTAQEIDAYIRSAHIRVTAYRNEATTILGIFAREVMAGQYAESINKINLEHAGKLKEQESESDKKLRAEQLRLEALLAKQKSFGSAVFENVVGGIATTILTAFTILVLILVRTDGIDLLARQLGFQRTPDTINSLEQKSATDEADEPE